jgi:cardiolipin synthase
MPASPPALLTPPWPPPQLLQGGEAFFPALMAAIDGAADWIQLETYIFDFHGAGAEVAEALMRAARRGLRVQVLVDGIGTQSLAARWAEKLKSAGVQWQVYAPLLGSWRGLGLVRPEQWRRLHRKLCVVDQRIVFCGGINMLDDFFDPRHGALDAPRFDFTVALEGPVADAASEAMALLWWRVQAGYSARHHHLAEAWAAFKAAGNGGRLSAAYLARAHALAMSGQPMQARPARSLSASGAALLLRDNLLNRNIIERAYRRAIGQARKEILIANAYFLPGGRLRRALIRAARRGVKVTLLLQGRYEYFMQYHAARPVYGALLDAGVEIHEYEASFLHAKVAVVDGHWSTVGSSNLDPFSLLLAREANVVINDRPFAHELQQRLLTAIAGHGRRVEVAEYSRRPWDQRLLGHAAYALMRLALLLTGQRY